MSIVDKKKEVFGKISAARTLTEGLPVLKTVSSFSSINNDGNVVNFLTDLIKSLIGFDALESAVIDTITRSLPKIEKQIKNTLKTELKSIVSCGVDPTLPFWITSDGDGIIIEVEKIDFANIFKTDPNSVGGKLIYDDITEDLTNSSDFNTFLYGVIQDEGVTYTWQNIFDITFNSLGSGLIPNNTLTIKANASYNTKTLTDLNNDFINSITLFSSPKILNKVIDAIYGSISSTVGKSINQLKKEADLNTIIDKMVNNVNVGPINDSDFNFSKAESYKNELDARNRKLGLTQLNVDKKIASSVPISALSTFNTEFASAGSSVLEQRNVISKNLKNMASLSAINVPKTTDVPTVKLNFIQEIVSNLSKSMINIVLSPKVVFSFLINYKIVYGPQAEFDDGIDFIKKNKNLMNNIMKSIAEEIIKVLMGIALKEIAELAKASFIKKQKEKATNKILQIQTLAGVQVDKAKNLLNNSI
jgi:hypothetical protein